MVFKTIYKKSKLKGDVPYQGEINGLRSPSQVVTPLGEVIATASRKNAGITICEFDPRDCKENRKIHMVDRHPETYVLMNRI